MAISRNRIKPMIYKYLFKVSKDAGIKMDFNAVEHINGSFETPLDYIDNLIAGKTPIIVGPVLKKEFDLLRRRLVKRFNAKKFRELPNTVQNQYKDRLLDHK